MPESTPEKALSFVLHGGEAILHHGDVRLELFHIVLLLKDEIALFEQLLAVRGKAHLVFELIRLHVHLHEIPKVIQLHEHPSISQERPVRALKSLHIILYSIYCLL